VPTAVCLKTKFTANYGLKKLFNLRLGLAQKLGFTGSIGYNTIKMAL